MKRRLIYISPDDTPFTKKDIDFLSKRYEIMSFQRRWTNKSKIAANFIREFFFLVKNMPKSDATVIMFGGYWSLLPGILAKILNKRVFIIPGGTDCVSFPEYQYGNLRKSFLKQIIKWSYSLADRLLPVDESLVITNYDYDDGVKGKKQGFKYHFPDLSTPYTVINNGFDAEYWNYTNKTKNQYVFTTIARVYDQSRYIIKGIDLVIQLAMAFPVHRFHIIGMDLDFAKSLGILPENVIVHDFLSSENIKLLLQESQYYLQLSVSEGFPNALCEAMLCGCIPVCSNVGGMPFIIRDTGLLIEKKDIKLAVLKVSALVNKSPDELQVLGEHARNNIKNRFSINKRENAFLEILEGKPAE